MKRQKSDNIVEYALTPSVEIVGQSECFVDGIKRINKYTNENIVFQLGKYCVSVFGDGLFIESFSGGGAEVRGKIVSVEFLRDDKNNKMADGNA